MKTLTIVSAIFIPLTFIVGVYGMNFENMPELEYPYGYHTVIGIMVLMGIGMLIYFKKEGGFNHFKSVKIKYIRILKFIK